MGTTEKRDTPNDNNGQNDNNPSTTKPKSRIPQFDNALSEDEKVVKQFVDTVQSKIDNGTLRSPSAKENEIIRKFVFYPGFFVGCFVGIGSFTLLRRVPVYILDTMELQRHEYIKKNVKQITDAQNIRPKPFKEGPATKIIGEKSRKCEIEMIFSGARNSK